MRNAVVLLLLVVAAVGLFFWYQMQAGPRGERGPDSPAIVLPEFLRKEDPDRLFCAESPETGACRCITAGGDRPPVGDEECRRRARE